MFDYNQLIFDFIKSNFESTYPDLANVKFTTDEFLSFLFFSFPNGCISDYELNEILLSLDYERHVYTTESICLEKNEHGEEVETKKQKIVSGWCFFSNKIAKPVM